MTLNDKFENIYGYAEEYIGRSKKHEQARTGKKSNHETTKGQLNKSKYKQFFGPVLFATILLFVVGCVVLACITCKSGYRIVQYNLDCTTKVTLL